MNGALHPVVISEGLWGLNPAQAVLSANSGAAFPGAGRAALQIAWCLLGWVSSSLLWHPIASLWHAPGFSSFHPLYRIQNPRFKAVMTLGSLVPSGQCSALTMNYFVLSSRVCGIHGDTLGRAGGGMAEPRCFQAMVSERGVLFLCKRRGREQYLLC